MVSIFSDERYRNDILTTILVSVMMLVFVIVDPVELKVYSPTELRVYIYMCMLWSHCHNNSMLLFCSKVKLKLRSVLPNSKHYSVMFITFQTFSLWHIIIYNWLCHVFDKNRGTSFQKLCSVLLVSCHSKITISSQWLGYLHYHKKTQKVQAEWPQFLQDWTHCVGRQTTTHCYIFVTCPFTRKNGIFCFFRKAVASVGEEKFICLLK